MPITPETRSFPCTSLPEIREGGALISKNININKPMNPETTLLFALQYQVGGVD